MTAPSISVALATYNGSRFICEQLESLATQTLLPDEVVITDDGSTDDTLQLAQSFAKSVPFKLLLNQNSKRLGYSRNFEEAICRCRGDIIFLCDQDDVWFADKLATVCHVFNSAENIQLVLNGQIITDGDLRHRNITMLDNIRSLGLNSDSLIEGCCTALRQTWAKVLFPMPATAEDLIEARFLSHDQWINKISVLLGVRAFVERPLQYFRRHSDNTTQWLGNTPTPIRLTDLITTGVKYAPVEAWETRVEVLDVYRQWLEANRLRLQASGVHSVNSALRKLEDESASYLSRSALACLPLASRAPKIWQMWREGGYQYFKGWRSALRDLSRGAYRTPRADQDFDAYST